MIMVTAVDSSDLPRGQAWLLVEVGREMHALVDREASPMDLAAAWQAAQRLMALRGMPVSLIA